MKILDAQLRQALAIEASQAVARKFGVQPEHPTVLKDTNHTIVHLRPSPIVAKVSVEKRFRQRSSSLEREVQVTGLLAVCSAPVVRPCRILPPGPHRTASTELTFWDYCPADTSRSVKGDEVGRSLRAIHNALLELGPSLPPLPHFTLQLDEADELLQRATPVPQLPDLDRLFLLNLSSRIKEAIRKRQFENRPVHGECNAGQTILTAGGLVWLDFEAACTGPKEWDLAVLDDESVKAYGAVDPLLISLMRTARTLCVTTWCWTQPDRAPEVREAAEYHLERLKCTAPQWT